MFWSLFGRKREDVREIQENVKNSFSVVRNDMEKIRKWLYHFKEISDYHSKKHEEQNKKQEHHNNRIEDLYFKLSQLEKRMEDVWTRVQTDVQTGQTGVQTPVQTATLSKRTQTDVRLKQTTKRVQTTIQTDNEELLEMLRSLTPMERVVVWTLLNTDLKLSYEDLCSALGKGKSTLRGQINNIKRKSESLIKEYAEIDGTKRFYITESLKQELLGKINRKKKEKEGEKEEMSIRIDGVG